MSERVESLLLQMLEEQRKTNELLSLLIQAMGEPESEDGEDEPLMYMDGSLVRG